MKKESRMARDAFVFLPAKLIEGLLIMAVTVLYTDLFSQTAYADFQLINTTVLFLYLVGAGWLANSAVRFVGDHAEKDTRRTFFSTVGALYLGVAGAVILAALVIYGISGRVVYPAGAVMFCGYALFQILNGVLVQSGKVAASVTLSLFNAAAKLGGGYLYTSLLSGGAETPWPAVAAAVSADLITGAAALIVLDIPHALSVSHVSKDAAQTFLRYGVPLVGFSVSVGLLNMADRYIVSFLAGKEQFAVYSANNSISSGVFTLIMAGIMRGVYPAVLRGWREEGLEKVKFLLDRGARLYLLVALPAVAGLLAIGGTLSQTFFSRPEYHQSMIIGVSACAMFFMGLAEYANKAWEVTRDTVPILQNSLIAAGIKVGVTFLLAGRFGITGAAAGSLIAFLSYYLIAWARVRKKFVFSIPPTCLLRIALSGLLCGAAARLACMLPAGGVQRIILAVCCGAAVYFLSLAASGEVREEMTAIRRFIERRMNNKR